MGQSVFDSWTARLPWDSRGRGACLIPIEGLKWFDAKLVLLIHPVLVGLWVRSRWRYIVKEWFLSVFRRKSARGLGVCGLMASDVQFLGNTRLRSRQSSSQAVILDDLNEVVDRGGMPGAFPSWIVPGVSIAVCDLFCSRQSVVWSSSYVDAMSPVWSSSYVDVMSAIRIHACRSRHLMIALASDVVFSMIALGAVDQ